MIQPTPKEWSISNRADDVKCDLLHAHFINHQYDRHIHCGYAIGVITQGVEKFWCEGKTYHAPANSIVAVNPYQVHDGSPGIDDGFIYRMFYFSPEDYNHALSEIGAENISPPFFPECVINDPGLSRQLIRLHYVLETEIEPLLRHEFWVQTMGELAFRHAEFPTATSINRTNFPATFRMHEYLHDNLSSTISLDELAQTAGLSPFQALRRFKASYGMTPHRYLTNIRVFKAQDLLIKGYALADAAAESGFADQAHLTRWYKRIYGITPGKYAASCNNVQYS